MLETVLNLFPVFKVILQNFKILVIRPNLKINTHLNRFCTKYLPECEQIVYKTLIHSHFFYCTINFNIKEM